MNDVKWAGMAESLRLHAEDKAVFIDCRTGVGLKRM